MSAALPTPDAPDVPDVLGDLGGRGDSSHGGNRGGASRRRWARVFHRMYPDVTSQVNSQLGQGFNSARDLAWNNARLLWAVRDDPLARGLFLDSLAASTALASRMLLVAV
ncbi:MAG: hypothetical protein ACLPS1_10190 [Streptosporangiaceae bacterium]